MGTEWRLECDQPRTVRQCFARDFKRLSHFGSFAIRPYAVPTAQRKESGSVEKITSRRVTVRKRIPLATRFHLRKSAIWKIFQSVFGPRVDPFERLSRRIPSEAFPRRNDGLERRRKASTIRSSLPIEFGTSAVDAPAPNFHSEIIADAEADSFELFFLLRSPSFTRARTH